MPVNGGKWSCELRLIGSLVMVTNFTDYARAAIQLALAWGTQWEQNEALFVALLLQRKSACERTLRLCGLQPEEVIERWRVRRPTFEPSATENKSLSAIIDAAVQQSLVVECRDAAGSLWVDTGHILMSLAQPGSCVHYDVLASLDVPNTLQTLDSAAIQNVHRVSLGQAVSNRRSWAWSFWPTSEVASEVQF